MAIKKIKFSSEKKEAEKFITEGFAPSKEPKTESLLTKEEQLDEYSLIVGEVPVRVSIKKNQELVPLYNVSIPGIGAGTKIVLDNIKEELITSVRLNIADMLDPRKAVDVKKRFETRAKELLARHFPTLTESKETVLIAYLLQNTLEMGELEFPMHDENLEEIVINGMREPVWVYHRKYGWLKTNISYKKEGEIYNLAARVGRRVGRQINVLEPLMDAHLVTGDRVNATLFPISTCGNTITIRKFARNPWTVVEFIKNKTTSRDIAALLWLCIQNELSLLVSGGTASGKTSMLNALSCFFPPNQRIISIEDTRELTLPDFLHWIPMTTRQPNPEGKGEVSMLDLLVNSLRMRPDRIIVGEIRRQKQAEVLFEAMHTGHSVCATVHADNAKETINRLTNPPINVPSSMVSAISCLVVQYRHRRLGIRRTLELAEVTESSEANVLYRWDLKSDVIKRVGELKRLAETMEMYAGMSKKEIELDLKGKREILDWMVKENINTVNEFGRVVAEYYTDSDSLLKSTKKGLKYEKVVKM